MNDEKIQVSKHEYEKFLQYQQEQEQKQRKEQQRKPKISVVIRNQKASLFNLPDVNSWTTRKFSWDSQVIETLQRAFGKDQFKTNQKAIVNLVLSGKDVFVCMPTGYGKSLTFQIPACIETGISIIIMPLISLIFDQVTYLNSLGISVLNASGSNKIPQIEDIISKQFKMLYTTPEKIEKSDHFKQLLNDLFKLGHIKRFVVDEAHCVSKWGRDFRPDYLKLENLRKSFPKIPIMALTATAPEEVKDDIIKVLNIVGCEYLQSSFNRPNLIYEVRPRDTKEKTLLFVKQFINQTYPKQSGIIYCLTQNECEHVSIQLKSLGIDSDYYHAGLTENQRNSIHKKWILNDIQVIVATVAFGMGIDKKDCRFVIHYQMPKSIENYYQESGRAGRDGKVAHCLLFFSNNDYSTNLLLMDRDEVSEKIKKSNILKLDKMQSYCYDKTNCRRELQLNYLGERFDRADCTHKCDNCANLDENAEREDLTLDAIRILNSVLLFPITEKQLTNILKGSMDKKAKEMRYSKAFEEIFGMYKQKPYIISDLIAQLRYKGAFIQKIQQINAQRGKFKNKVVYLTTSQDIINRLGPVEINIIKKRTSIIVHDDGVQESLMDRYMNRIGKQQPIKTNQIWSMNQSTAKTEQKQTNKLKYDRQFGYLIEEQFNDLRERLIMVRKIIYNDKVQRSEELIGLDFILSDDEIYELCKKLPLNRIELNDSSVRIAHENKKKDYIMNFIEEIIHFIESNSIDKKLFEEPPKTIEIEQVFDIAKNIIIQKEDSDDVQEIYDQRTAEQQIQIDDIECADESVEFIDYINNMNKNTNHIGFNGRNQPQKQDMPHVKNFILQYVAPNLNQPQQRNFQSNLIQGHNNTFLNKLAPLSNQKISINIKDKNFSPSSQIQNQNQYNQYQFLADANIESQLQLDDSQMEKKKLKVNLKRKFI